VPWPSSCSTPTSLPRSDVSSRSSSSSTSSRSRGEDSGSCRPDIGIIYLDLPNRLRTIPEINRLLAAFFRQHAEGVDLEHSLVVVTEHEVRIVRG
jgi:hypothetical protein